MSQAKTDTLHLATHPEVTLTRKAQQEKLSGVSEKGIYLDPTEREYYVKEPKLRKADTIFAKDPAYQALLTQKRDLEALGESTAEIQAALKGYEDHVHDLMIANTALETIAPAIAKGIMGNTLIAPDNIFFMGKKDNPCTASPSVGELNEFLTSLPKAKGIKTPEDWKKASATRPQFKEVVTNPEDAYILGQAYFVGLLMGHLDLVNNIDLSNFGKVVDETGVARLCIVDWGNSLGVGFSGLTAEEGAFSNPALSPEAKVPLQHEDITDFQQVVPFDEVVFPRLPRQVASDLFDLTSQDVPNLREAQRQGFYDACNTAIEKLNIIKELVPGIMQEVLNHRMSERDADIVKSLLPDSIYQTKTGPTPTDVYNLGNVLEGRLKSLQKMKEALESGQSMESIAAERLHKIQDSQSTPEKANSTAAMLAALGGPGQAVVEESDREDALSAVPERRDSTAATDSEPEIVDLPSSPKGFSS